MQEPNTVQGFHPETGTSDNGVQKRCSLLLEAQYSYVFKESSMREFQADGRTISAYLAEPSHGSGPGVLVLHAWWGLTEPFRQVCDRLAEAGFVALAPDLYRGKLALVGFSLGGAYALDMSVTLAEEIAAVVTFYAAYPGLDYIRASAAYLCHFAEDDPFEPAESAAEMERALKAAGRPVTCYTYPGTKHWFFEDNRPEYDAQAARLAWERTIAFLLERLD